MGQQDLLFEKTGAVAAITFNRPDKANAMGPDWLQRMIDFLREVEHDAAIRCVLIRAKGKHFQAGVDVEELSARANEPQMHRRESWFRQTIGKGNELYRSIVHLPKPVVSSVQGGVVGAGLTIAGACDLVIAADDAFFCQGQIINGYSLDGMPSYFLPRQIGHRKAMEWTLLGSRVTASEAARLGFVNFVVPRDRLAAETQVLVDKLANGPTRAYAINKMLMLSTWHNGPDEQAGLEVDLYMKTKDSRDWLEGTKAFIERRAPQFSGE